MMFCTPTYTIKEVDEESFAQIADVYNANPDFLKSHIGAERVDKNWVLNECMDMKKSGFTCCKIGESQSDTPVGLIDFKLSKQTYLSLLMIHGKARHRGVGREVMQYFEKYIKENGARQIRIDVVTQYDDAVLHFWQKNGFVVKEEITLNWNNRQLPALKMIKELF